MTDELEKVNGAAPAAESMPPAQTPPAPPPSSGDAPAASPSKPTGGAAPLTLEQLQAIPEAQRTPYQKRKLRELEIKRAADERRQKREAKKVKAAPAAAAPAAAELDEDARDDKARAREAAMFWRFVFRLVNLIVWPFGFRVEKLAPAEAAEDAEYLVPLARKYRWFDVAIRWAALPFVLLERLTAHLKKRDTQPGGKP